MNRPAVSLLLLALIAVGAVAAYVLIGQGGACDPQKATESSYPRLTSSTFGAVTEYALPRSMDWANGVTVASDGSVWFGEQALPGVARFDPAGGQLTEYKWSCYASPFKEGPVTSIWGIAQWDGKVWAADGDGNRLIGLNPSDGSLTYVNTTNAKFPYLLAPAPDGSLWFTTLSTVPTLGRLGTDMQLRAYPVTGVGKEEPIQILFENSTFAYMVALNPLSPTGEGGLYSFDPMAPGGTIAATRVGGNFSLIFPDGLTQSGSQIWVTQHYPSNLVVYDLKTGGWTTYPTSLVSFSPTTFPYFVQAAGSGVWFNEHYANKIGWLDPASGTMTEFSEADPPVSNGTNIHNDLTIALGQGGLWFTSATADYIGFVSGAYAQPFSLSASGTNRLTLSPGGSTTVHLQVKGSWSDQLRVQVSDSESITSVPSLIGIQPGSDVIPAGAGPTDLAVTVSAQGTLRPGSYTLDVTVTDGLVFQTAFLFLTVT